MQPSLLRAGALCAGALGIFSGVLLAPPVEAAVPPRVVFTQEVPQPVTLSGEPESARFSAGRPVRLNFTATNAGATACALTTAATGSLTVTAVARDGKSLTPVVSPLLLQDGLGPVTSRGLASTAAGGQAQLSLESTDLSAAGLPAALPSVTWSEESGSVEALWPVDTPGRYEATVAYAFPPVPGRPEDVCPGTSRPVSVAFTVDGPRRTSGWPAAWVALGGGTVVCAAVVLRVRSRRRPPTAAGLTLLAFVSAGALVLGDATYARAEISASPAAAAAFGRCMSTYRAEDESGDPAGVVRDLQFSQRKVRIVLNNGTKANPGDTGTVPAGDAWDKATNGTGTDSVIYWNSQSTLPLSDGTPSDPCAQLYHEMNHARDMAHGTLDLHQCSGAGPGLQTDEVAATLAENAYRRFRGLPERTAYGGIKLPPSVDSCKANQEKQRKFPKHGPAGTDCPAEGCGGSNGDPHVTTFDGLRYDFQAAGEFTAVESTTGDLRIQVRQVPYPGSTLVSVNKAVAANAAGDRVGLYLDESGIDVRVNGTLRPVPEGDTALPHGGTVTRASADGLESYRVTWPDGTFLTANVVGSWGLNVQVRLAPAHRAHVRGLLGDFNGDPDQDVRTREGETLPKDPPFDRLYHAFADSWRVNQADSLFDYASGESTGTFTLRDFPERPTTLGTVPNRSVATVLCQAAGVAAGPPLDECVMDAALTGQASFVLGAAATPPTGSAPAIVHDGDLVTGNITERGQSARYQVALDGATVFAVADWRGTSDGCDQTFTIDLVGGSGNNFPCTGGNVQFTVPDPAGSHEVQISSPTGGTGPYRFRLVTVKPRTLGATPGQRVEGSLDVRGREDRYEFDAAGATTARLTDLPPGCGADLVADLRDMTSGTPLSGNNALCGNPVGPVSLPDPTHRYAVVIRSRNLDTGRYTFRLEAGG
ncbi:VWD domain-containing protein [Kitasatospora sp. NPDC048298]|uniref:VWD domain-containing protein n=1 Tax=Kitasatospora sp. NPDC048298 TaxID=3364049 RepID=UPI0037104E6C